MGDNVVHERHRSLPLRLLEGGALLCTVVALALALHHHWAAASARDAVRRAQRTAAEVAALRRVLPAKEGTIAPTTPTLSVSGALGAAGYPIETYEQRILSSGELFSVTTLRVPATKLEPFVEVVEEAGLELRLLSVTADGRAPANDGTLAGGGALADGRALKVRLEQ